MAAETPPNLRACLRLVEIDLNVAVEFHESISGLFERRLKHFFDKWKNEPPHQDIADWMIDDRMQIEDHQQLARQIGAALIYSIFERFLRYILEDAESRKLLKVKRSRSTLKDQVKLLKDKLHIDLSGTRRYGQLLRLKAIREVSLHGDGVVSARTSAAVGQPADAHLKLKSNYVDSARDLVWTLCRQAVTDYSKLIVSLRGK